MPRGQTLPADAWEKRHRALFVLLCLHAVFLPVFGALQGYGVAHSVVHAALLPLIAAVAYRLRHRRRLAATAVSVGLITASALMVHLSGGVIEAHFHFFVMIVVLAIYEDWLPFLMAAAYVVVHHGLTGALAPHDVYNHPDAVAHPWKWAAIHGAFVTAAGVASVVAWRLNEIARAEVVGAHRHARESEERFRAAFDEAPIGMVLARVTPEGAGELAQVNRAMCELSGYQEHQLLSKSLRELCESDIHAFQALRQLLSGESHVCEVEASCTRADGSAARILVHGSLLHVGEDEARYAIVQLQDITERRDAEAQLERQRRQLVTAQSVGQLGSWEWNLVAGTIEWSQQFHRIYGIEPRETPLTFEDFFEHVHEDDRAHARSAVESAYESGGTFSFEHRIVRADAGVRIALVRGEVVTDADGRPLRMFGTAQDITERKRDEEARLRLATLVDSSEDAIFAKTLDGTVLTWNRGAQELYGYCAEEVVGKPLAVLVPPERRGELEQILARIGRGEVVRLETVRVGKQGRPIDVSITVSPILDAAGEPTAASTIERDISERKRAEAELRRSSRYFELSRDLVCTAGFDGYFKQLNAAWTQVLGWTVDELCSRPFVDFVHPDDREITERESAKLVGGGATVDFVNRYATKDGGWRWIDWSASVAPDEELIYASARDITERKGIEAALAASERQTRQILETAHDAFIAIDDGGIITDWNSQAEATFGWPREEVLGRELAETIIPQAQRSAHRRGLARFLETGRGTVLGQLLELSALHRDGHEFPVELTISPLRGENGYSFNAFLRDITERKAAAELLERQRRQLVEAQSVGQFGSWEWDIVADKTEWSEQLYRIYGVEPDDAPRSFEDFLALVHPDDRAAVEAAVRASYASGEPFALEHRVVRPDGVVRVHHAHGDVVLGEEGTPVRMHGTGQDITERREIERAKEEFTSVVSHELRTPLTSIRGSLGLLESGVLGTLSAKGQRMVEIAVQNTDRLVRLINDILDVERIDSGEIEMDEQRCDAAELIEQAIDALAQVAADAEVRVLRDLQPATLFADPDRVIQTLTNLISNAVKFSPRGGAVTVSCAPSDAEVLFEVRDQGRGIPAEKLSTIFGRFQQVDASDAREKGGTGLGLAICRGIVEQHGGRIWVDSTLGKGSTFAFTLPGGVDEESPPDVAADDGDRPTVLVCDDDASTREVLQMMLEQHGFRAIPATSGEEALRLAESQRPDVVLLDLLMPGIDGWETAAALTERAALDRIPIVVLSALSKSESDPVDGDVVDWIEKPLDDSSLMHALEQAVERGGRERARVLVVEDDDDLSKVLCAMLEQHGLETFRAATGPDAITLSQRVLPDLLVLDLGLPEADGFSVVDWLRRHDRLHAVPMVVYTGRELASDERKRLRLGGETVFLSKGCVSPDAFEGQVLQLLGRITKQRREVVGNGAQAGSAGR